VYYEYVLTSPEKSGE